MPITLNYKLSGPVSGFRSRLNNWFKPWDFGKTASNLENACADRFSEIEVFGGRDAGLFVVRSSAIGRRVMLESEIIDASGPVAKALQGVGVGGFELPLGTRTFEITEALGIALTQDLAAAIPKLEEKNIGVGVTCLAQTRKDFEYFANSRIEKVHLAVARTKECPSDIIADILSRLEKNTILDEVFAIFANQTAGKNFTILLFLNDKNPDLYNSILAELNIENSQIKAGLRDRISDVSSQISWLVDLLSKFPAENKIMDFAAQVIKDGFGNEFMHWKIVGQLFEINYPLAKLLVEKLQITHK